MKNSMFLYETKQSGLGLGPYGEDVTNNGQESESGGSFWDKANNVLDTVNNAADTVRTIIGDASGSGSTNNYPNGNQPAPKANLVKTGLWVVSGTLGIYALTRLISKKKKK